MQNNKKDNNKNRNLEKSGDKDCKKNIPFGFTGGAIQGNPNKNFEPQIIQRNVQYIIGKRDLPKLPIPDFNEYTQKLSTIIQNLIDEGVDPRPVAETFIGFLNVYRLYLSEIQTFLLKLIKQIEQLPFTVIDGKCSAVHQELNYWSSLNLDNVISRLDQIHAVIIVTREIIVRLIG